MRPAAPMRIARDLELPASKQPCAMCGGDDFEALVHQDRHLLGLHTCGCRRCGLVQINPRPDAAGLATFYERHYRRFYQGVTDPDQAYVHRFHKGDRLRYTSAHLLDVLSLRDDSILLDYGCGEGSLFVALRDAGYRGHLLGVEPNPQFAQYAARSSQATVHASIDAVETVDAVVLNHVLEHLADPVSTLLRIRSCLREAGRLYVDVPDADRYTSVSDFHIAHLLHFNQSTLTAVVQAAGFDVLACEAHDPPHHPRSLRLLARPGSRIDVPALDAGASQRTWRHLRTLDARRWRWVMSQRLAPIAPLRWAYRSLRRWTAGKRGNDV
jgi:SAM-dependent methyltransferase